jgi:hypothetical protein
MKKFVVVALSTLTVGFALTAAAPASARVNWSVNVGVGGYGGYGGYGYYPPPVVYAPRPYYPAPPVVYSPAPVYVQPAYGQPVYQQPYYPAPVYVQPAQYNPPVYIQRPDPRYTPPDYQGGYQRAPRDYPDYRR